MLSESQVKRLLAQCETASKSNPSEERWTGWCQALRLVLEKNTYPINSKPLENKEIE